MFDKPLIDPAKCDGCGVCVSVCPKTALVFTDRTINFDAHRECSWCGDCEAVCSGGAISCPYEITFAKD